MDNKIIGKRIKNLRVQKDLTLDDLAKRSDLSKGFLSQLERGLTSPALDTLHDILEALGTDFSTFFKNTKSKQTIYKNSDYIVKKNSDSKIEWLVLNAQKNDLEPIRLTLDKNGSSFTVDPFDGEHFVYILSGEGQIHLGSETLQIKANETFYSEANQPVKVSNTSEKKMVLIWITTPPYF